MALGCTTHLVECCACLPGLVGFKWVVHNSLSWTDPVLSHPILLLMLAANMEDTNNRDSIDTDRGGPTGGSASTTGGAGGGMAGEIPSPQQPSATTPTPGASATNGNTQTADPQLILDHIHRLLPLLIDADPVDLQRSLPSANLEIADKLRRFATDPQVPVLFAIKEISSSAGTTNGDSGEFKMLRMDDGTTV